MKNKNPKIFSINQEKPEPDFPSIESMEVLIKLNELLLNKNYKEVIKRVKKDIKKYPDNYFFYIVAAISHSMENEYDEALKLLLEAKDKFSNNNEIYFQLGKIYQDLRDFENAIKSFEESYELTEENDEVLRSECLNEIGVVYWDMGRKDEALEQWKLALMENPKNIEAYNNVRELTNEYDEPVAVSPIMDDIFHFQKLQIDKYLKFASKREIDDGSEMQNVIGLIMETWNEVVTHEQEKLDSLSTKEKTDWFNSIDIDFSKEPDYQFPLLNDDQFDNEYYDMLTIYDTLDEEDILFVPFTFPFLLALGIPQNRLDHLFSSVVEPTDYEIDMMDWALAIVDILLDMEFEGTKADEKKEGIKIAIEIAKHNLDEDSAEKAVLESLEIIKMVAKDAEKMQKKKPPQKKKKNSKKRR